MANVSDTKKCHYNEEKEIWITPKGIVTFAAIEKKWRARDAKKDDEGQYALTLVVPPECDLRDMKLDAHKIAQAEWGNGIEIFKPGKNKGKKHPFLPAGEKTTLTDENGDEVDLEKWVMLRANSYLSKRPPVRDAKGEQVDVDDLAEKLANGVWARMSVRIKPYNNSGNSGIKFYLEGIQLLNGPKYDTGTSGGSTGDEFGAVDDDGAGEDDPLA